ncbi:MAG: LemA family protein, partial [Chlamydiia bacterium]|nr:LemA family protein [Chlamydiia bacterium]
MDELAGTENRISVERMRYNEVIRQYNVRVRSFPARLLAAPCGFQTHAYLEVSPAAAEAVKVDFS